MQSSAYYTRYFGQLTRIKITLSNFDKAELGGLLNRADVDLAYRSSFLAAVVALELAIEGLFYGLLTGVDTHTRACHPVMLFPNATIAEQIIAKGSYMQWLPAARLVDSTRFYFDADGNPFDCLEGDLKGVLATCTALRNYIAHESASSKRKLEAAIGPLNKLPKGSQDILGYFRRVHSGKVTKMELHLGELADIAKAICT